jgi:hypothetical protein
MLVLIYTNYYNSGNLLHKLFDIVIQKHCWKKMAQLTTNHSRAMRCHTCDISFREEIAFEVHRLTHEISNLKMLLDSELRSLNATLSHVSRYNK